VKLYTIILISVGLLLTIGGIIYIFLEKDSNGKTTINILGNRITMPNKFVPFTIGVLLLLTPIIIKIIAPPLPPRWEPDFEIVFKGVEFDFSIIEQHPENYDLVPDNTRLNLWLRPNSKNIGFYAPNQPRGEGLIGIISSHEFYKVQKNNDIGGTVVASIIEVEDQAKQLRLKIDPGPIITHDLDTIEKDSLKLDIVFTGGSFNYSIKEKYPQNYYLVQENDECPLWPRPNTSLIYIYAPNQPKGQGRIAIIDSQGFYNFFQAEGEIWTAKVSYIKLEDGFRRLQLRINSD